MEDKKLFLIVYLRSQSRTDNLYIVSNNKIDAINLFMREMATKEIQITNVIDFGIISDSDLAVMISELDKKDNSPLWFD